MLLLRATSQRPLNIPYKLCRCQCSTLCSIPHSSALHVLPLSVLPSRTQKMFVLLILKRFKPTASHQIGQITTNGLDPCLEIRQHPNLLDLNTVLTSLTIELCGCHKRCHSDSPKVHKIVFNFMLNSECK
jgi:hypothetical protein